MIFSEICLKIPSNVVCVSYVLHCNHLQAQILTRKQVIRAVLDEQTRQRRCNQFDYTLVAMKSIEHSRVSIERARMIGFTNHADIYLLETKSSNYLES
jgi:heme exporter protein D